MLLTSISISNFRNLNQTKLEFNNLGNIFYGKNGSGKTSLLEAIYYLILGRSFRSHLLRRIIKYGEINFSIFGKIYKNDSLLSIGITKSIETSKKIKIAGQVVSSNIEITKLVPLQLLNYNSYCLLHNGSKAKRQFIDWGLFHVEQSFLWLWRKIERILEQRNTAIRLKSAPSYIKIWDKELAQFGSEIHLHRTQYIKNLIPIAQNILQKLLCDHPIKILYIPGWDTNLDLESFLANNLKNDLHFGYTTAGPHRADLEISIKKIPAKDALSRGQQKLLLYGLQIAQGILLNQLTGKKCIYLIDDLLAELDLQKCQLLAEILFALQKAQIFITGLTCDNLKNILGHNINDSKMFCLNNGMINN
jgi:DNA replication and repair protein RecF